ncbi:unnamed protein product [Eruca vesicaria subsp. sativa]|uniref:Uncharacterized protein n=1 Tax=Eruca vesicaria subsp. sativa TaxID=29727 RepID=A0ABC8K8J2_ERUVS|nr:unnamed protein product [Eruca vesicaria subsp. sativa]
MEAFNKASEAISARKGTATSAASGDDVMITGSSRKMTIKSEIVSSSQGRRLRGRMATRSSPRAFDAEHTAGGFSEALKDLNASVFLQESTPFSSGDPAEVILMLHERLLQVTSPLHRLGTRLLEEDVSSIKEEARELSRQLSEEKSRRIAQGMELRDLQTNIKAIEGAVETSSSEVLTLSRRNQELEETLERLRTERKTLEDMKVMAVNGVKIISRWEMMRDWLAGRSHSWDVAREFDRYKAVVIVEAKFRGVDPPSFTVEPHPA